MFSMFTSCVLDTEIVNDEHKHYWPPFVPPESWCCGALVVSMGGEWLCEEVVGKFACLFESIYTLGYFKADPTVVHVSVQIVFDLEFVRDICEVDAHIFQAIKWCPQIEVFYVIASPSPNNTNY
jgi:hypothetical protein